MSSRRTFAITVWNPAGFFVKFSSWSVSRFSVRAWLKRKKKNIPTICYSPRTRNRDQVLPSSNHFGQILEYSSVNFAEILQLLLVLIAHRLFASVCCIFIYLTLILYFFTFCKTFNSVECMHFLSLFVFPPVLQITNVRTTGFLNTIHHVFF